MARNHRRTRVVSSLSVMAVAISIGLGRYLTAAEKSEVPVVKVVAPFGLVRGTTTTVLVRGLRLSEIAELNFPDLKNAPVFKIKSKGPATANEKVPADKIGDTQIEAELTLAIDAPLGATPFLVIGPNGKSEPRQILILDQNKTITEKEPNDDFTAAQEITLGHTITGILSPNQKNDVFKFEGKKGQSIRVEAHSTRFGSPLEPFILLHGADGQLLAEADNPLQDSDPIIEFKLLKDGPHFLTIRDAKDFSSPLHAFVLVTQ